MISCSDIVPNFNSECQNYYPQTSRSLEMGFEGDDFLNNKITIAVCEIRNGFKHVDKVKVYTDAWLKAATRKKWERQNKHMQRMMDFLTEAFKGTNNIRFGFLPNKTQK